MELSYKKTEEVYSFVLENLNMIDYFLSKDDINSSLKILHETIRLLIKNKNNGDENGSKIF